MAQADLVPYDRVVGRGGGKSGAYRFSGVELAEIKAKGDRHIRELVAEARRRLTAESGRVTSPSPKQ